MQHQKKAKECLNRVLEYFKGNPEIPTVFLAGALSKSKILLEGSHGKGKTYVAELTAKVLGLDLSVVQGSAGLTESKFLARYDVGSLMKGEEKVDWKGFVHARMKLFDEINRTHPSILNGIFTMLARNRIDFGDESVDLQDYVFVGTTNPADSGTYQIPLPLYDRFDISILTEAVSFTDKLLILQNHKKPIEPVLAQDEIKELWAEVEQVKLPDPIISRLTTLTRDLQLCVHGSKEFIVNFPACCDGCRFKNWVCSAISNESPVSERLYQSIAKVAKSLAYLKGRDEVNNEDVNVILKYSLYHRLKLVSTYTQQHVTIGKATDKIIADICKKDKERAGAYALFEEAYKELDPAKVTALEEWAKNDLFLAELFTDFKDKFAEKQKQFEDGVKKLNFDELEELQKRIKDGKVKVSAKTADWIVKKLESNLDVVVPKTVDDLTLKAKLNRLDLKLSKEVRKYDLREEGVGACGDSGVKLEVTKDGVVLKAKDLEQKRVVQKFVKEVEQEAKQGKRQ